MKIVADENMPGLEALSRWAELERLPGRSISSADLVGADALLVRSVTAVNSRLLEASAVGFVGSATIGTDHVDLDWLTARGICFAHAPGCNARAVAEYVLQMALRWTQQLGQSLSGKRVGIVGLGNVGTEVALLFAALGCEVLAIDPPRQRDSALQCYGDRERGGGPAVWASEAEVLACDIVSLHVPLTRQGSDATEHLIDAAKLQRMSAGQLLMSTCRGAVIDNEALQVRLAQPDAPAVVLDVWEQEPRVPARLFQRVMLGTPHIAGYSAQGKLQGSAMVVAALHQWMDTRVAQGAGVAEGAKRQVNATLIRAPRTLWPHPVENETDLLALLTGRYDLSVDHRQLQASLLEQDPAAAFDRLRKQYAGRDELSGIEVEGAVNGVYRPVLRLLGVAFADIAGNKGLQ